MTSPANAKTVRMEVLKIMKGSGEIVEPAAAAFAKVIKDAAGKMGKDGHAIIDSLSWLILECIQDTAEHGGDTGKLVKALALSVFRTPNASETEAWRAVNNIAHLIMLKVIQTGADLEKVSLEFLRGVIQGAKERHWGAEEAAQVAAQSAVRGAYDSSPAAGNLVRETLTGTISGVKLDLEKPEHV